MTAHSGGQVSTATALTERATLSARARGHLAVPLFRNAYALVLSTAVTSVLGVLYWAIAARRYTPEDVGRAATAISAMVLLSGIAQLNLTSGLPRFLPTAGPRTRHLVLAAYAAAGALACAAAVVYLALSDVGSLGLSGTAAWWGRAWFVVAVMAWCIFTLQDSVLTGLRQAVWVPVENGAFAVLKILLLLVFADGLRQVGIFASWTIPVALSLIPVNGLIFRRLIPRHRRIAVAAPAIGLGQIVRFVAADYAGALFQLASVTMLPLLVAARLGLPAAAFFYAAWVVASAFELVLSNLGTSLVVEGANDELRISSLSRAIVRLAAACVIPVLVATAVLAPRLLSLLGHGYAAEATTLLRLLCLGMVFRAVVVLHISVARVQRRFRALVTTQMSLCVGVLGLSFLLLRPLGIAGVGVAYAVTQGGVATALTATRSVQALRARGGAGWRRRVMAVGPALLTVVAMVLWAASLRHVDASRVNALGLISVIGPLYPASIALLCVAFAWNVSRPRVSTAVCVVQVVALIVALNTLAAIVETEPSYFSAYLHAGFVNYIGTHGSVLPRLDARFSWPGSFSLGALIVRTAGLDDAVALIRWAPVVFELLYLAPLLAITRAVTGDARVRWTAVWLFYLANWIGQDYLSPQAMNFFFALVVVAAVLHFSPRARRLWPSGRRAALLARVRSLTAGSEVGRDEVEPDDRTPSTGQRLVVLGATVVIIATTTVSHQVTPVILGVLLGALWLTGRVASLRLAILCAVMFLGYLSLGAQDFWVGHLDALTGGFGQVNKNLNANVGGRVRGTDLHRVVLDARIVLVVVMVALGGLGLVRAWRAGRNRLAWAVMAAAPLPLVGVQSYGGEAVLRSYLFALPFLCILAAHAFFVPGRRSLAGAIALAVAGAGLGLGFVTARYGNDQFEQVAPSEHDAVAWVYDHAPHGSTLVAASRNLPWRYRDVDTYFYVPPDDAILSNPDNIVRLLESRRGPAFFISTDGQQVFGQELYGLPAGWLNSLDAELEHTGRVQVVFQEGDARVYALYGALEKLP